MVNTAQIEKLDTSFNEMWTTGAYGEQFREVYDRLRPDIAELGFTSCFVDLSNRRMRIEFILFYDTGLQISVARQLDEDEVDFFAISRNKEKLVISQMQHSALMTKLKEVEQLS